MTTINFLIPAECSTTLAKAPPAFRMNARRILNFSDDDVRICVHLASARSKLLPMRPGIYHVKFSSPTTHGSGEGLAVIGGHSINGGDPGYIYSGTFRTDDNLALAAEIKIKQWNPGWTSIFGNISEFVLNLTGEVTTDWNKFSARGGIVGHPQTTILIDGRRLADAHTG